VINAKLNKKTIYIPTNGLKSINTAFNKHKSIYINLTNQKKRLSYKHIQY